MSFPQGMPQLQFGLPDPQGPDPTCDWPGYFIVEGVFNAVLVKNLVVHWPFSCKQTLQALQFTSCILTCSLFL